MAELVVEGALDIAEGTQAVPTLVQAPQPPPAAVPAKSLPQRMARLVEEIVTGLSRMMDHVGVRYTSYLDFQIPYVRRTRHRTDDASTSAS
ncbi:hypothetical protein Tco_0323102 [Tanacetum coccineum]